MDRPAAWLQSGEQSMEVSPQQESVFHSLQSAVRNRVRELRENRLMTQVQLAKKAKVAVRTIQSVEKGMDCRMVTKRKLLFAFDLSLDQMSQVFVKPQARRASVD